MRGMEGERGEREEIQAHVDPQIKFLSPEASLVVLSVVIISSKGILSTGEK